MVYDATFWQAPRNWSALTGALTGAATRKDYPAMLRHIQAVRAAGMPEDRIRRAYAEVVAMVPSVPPLEVLEQGASGGTPAAGAPSAMPSPSTAPTTSAANMPPAVNAPPVRTPSTVSTPSPTAETPVN